MKPTSRKTMKTLDLITSGVKECIERCPDRPTRSSLVEIMADLVLLSSQISESITPRRGRPLKLTPEMIAEDLERGLSDMKIAVKHEVCLSTVRRVRKFIKLQNSVVIVDDDPVEVDPENDPG